MRLTLAAETAIWLTAQEDWAAQHTLDPLRVWCTGLGGGPRPKAGYDCILSCVSNAPTYGATLARADDWEKHRSAIGASLAVHEYFMLTAFATAGIHMWHRIPGVQSFTPGLIMNRAASVLSQAALVPTHRRDVHPVWQAAVRFLLKLQHPQVLLMLLNHSYMGLKQFFPEERRLDSAGSLNGLALHRIALDMAPTFSGTTVVGAWLTQTLSFDRNLAAALAKCN